MLKKTLTYKDYNNVERTETHFFNLSEAELTEMEMGTEGGYAEMLQNIIDAKDQVALIRTFKKIILKAYGVKSPDGREFIKSKKISKKFSQTEAFNMLYMELVTDTDAAIQFVWHYAGETDREGKSETGRGRKKRNHGIPGASRRNRSVAGVTEDADDYVTGGGTWRNVG